MIIIKLYYSDGIINVLFSSLTSYERIFLTFILFEIECKISILDIVIKYKYIKTVNPLKLDFKSHKSLK